METFAQNEERNSSSDSNTKLEPDMERGRTGIPSIPINLYEHKTILAIHWTVLLVCSCLLPIAMYFILKYVAKTKGSIVIGVSSAIFGAVSLPSLLRRTWSLTRAHSTTRPLGTTRWWQMDYFNFNFIFGFVLITVLIIISTILKPANTRIAAMPLALLLLQVCCQLLVTPVLMAAGARYPFRFSSMAKGEVARPAVYSIIEDVVAVDGGQGTRFREIFNQRYLASAPIRALLKELNLLWAVSGLAVGAAVIVVIWVLKNEDISWIIGWSVPWVWAGICAFITVIRTKAALRKEWSFKG